MPLARLQTGAVVVAVVAVVLGFAASLGHFLLPQLASGGGVLAVAHGVLAAFGLAAARAAVARGREIDRARWEYADDPLATADERELAHKDAERERRLAATAFLAAPVFTGYWLLYQVAGGGVAAALLPASALAAYALTFAVATRRGEPERRF